MHAVAHDSDGVVGLYISRHIASKHDGFMRLMCLTVTQLLCFNLNLSILFSNISDYVVTLLLHCYYI